LPEELRAYSPVNVSLVRARNTTRCCGPSPAAPCGIPPIARATVPASELFVSKVCLFLPCVVQDTARDRDRRKPSRTHAMMWVIVWVRTNLTRSLLRLCVGGAVYRDSECLGQRCPASLIQSFVRYWSRRMVRGLLYAVSSASEALRHGVGGVVVAYGDSDRLGTSTRLGARDGPHIHWQ
jgi:hypothetical protein